MYCQLEIKRTWGRIEDHFNCFVTLLLLLLSPLGLWPWQRHFPHVFLCSHSLLLVVLVHLMVNSHPVIPLEALYSKVSSADCSLVATVLDNSFHFQKDSSVVNFSVNGGPPPPSNPHVSLEYNGEVLVSDLFLFFWIGASLILSQVAELFFRGVDKIWRLVKDGAPGKLKVQGQIDVVPGNERGE